ncbi:MAG: class I SAM-dependent methyltransferase [Luteolibacter sp.]
MLGKSLQSLLKHAAYRCGFSLKRLKTAQRLSLSDHRHEDLVRPLIHARDPYLDFDWQTWPDDPSGWGSQSPAFAELVEKIRPRRIIEVGTWKGGSALEMARHTVSLGLQTEIICIDTWLGALEMWMDHTDETRYGALNLKNGYPSLYYQFLANVCYAGRQDIVTPLPLPSTTAAQWLAVHGVLADLIYIDGSHEEDDVYQDLTSYWDLLRPGGILLGDDWGWDGVRMAAERFARENSLAIHHRHDKWELHKNP